MIFFGKSCDQRLCGPCSSGDMCTQKFKIGRYNNCLFEISGGGDSLKVRIAVLWLLMAVFMSAHSLLYLMEPDVIDDIRSGDIYEGMDPGQMLFVMSLFWLIPLWMTFLSVVLKPAINRWVNIILGIVFTILNIWHLTEPCCVMAHQKLIVVSTVIASVLIVWYGWKLPREET